MAKIALVVGSVRRDRQGINVAPWLEQKLKDRDHIVYFIDPVELNLPLLDRLYKEMTQLGAREKMKKEFQNLMSLVNTYCYLRIAQQSRYKTKS